MMRRASLIPLLLLLAPGCTPPPHVASPPPAPAAPHAELRPVYLNITAYVRLAAHAAPQPQPYVCNLTCEFVAPEGFHAIAYTGLHLAKITTDSGATLEPPKPDPHVRAIDPMPLIGRPYLSLRLPVPPTGTRKFAQVRGDVTLILAHTIHGVELPPLRDILGKHVRIDGLRSKVSVAVRRCPRDRSIEIEMPVEARILLADVAFNNADGKPLAHRRLYSHATGPLVRFHEHVDLPDDGRIVLKFYDDTRDVAIPFTLRDLPLPTRPPPPPKATAANEPTVHATPVDPQPPTPAH